MKFTPTQLISLKQAYSQGLSLTELISSWEFSIDFEAISIIYDLQSGTYTKHSLENASFINSFTSEIVEILGKYIEKDTSILDCGTGEGSTIIPVLKKLGMEFGYAIDASISRLLWAQQNAASAGIDLKLAVCDLGRLPLCDNAVDAIITVHALEPNSGQETLLIKELGRVARDFVFLIEPDFENGSEHQKERMKKLGYVRGIDAAIKKNGYSIMEKIPLKNNSNKLNAASVTVVKTGTSGQKNQN